MPASEEDLKNLIFREIIECRETRSHLIGDPLVEVQEVPYTVVAYGLYRQDKTLLGICYWSGDYFQHKEENGWYLADINVPEHFRRNGYGTELLKRSCEKMWNEKKELIILARAGHTNNKTFEWFKKRGFEGHLSLDYMWQYPPS
ncbi:GNAT family N-acetyltransferase [Nostoc sp. FACHB-87]|uniref:GNAT family N-acetyltransferase n=1 Tax=Nostocaceae TaxID=1162 RepID=UPI0016843F47|nr:MULTISPECIES: GNAT family N-acetyltransferase [Nostocaceae]MBD2458723.1 GNAT family N-acetyltransferase [Nostoc sp. FACHB-87]MBD2479762.1 GNAT family N-acetyltransferase [Anabaena sp. FACHB-83]